MPEASTPSPGVDDRSPGGERGTIKTRSGTWDWEIKTFRPWPRSKPLSRRLSFRDPVNEVNTMSVRLEPEGDELCEKKVLRLSLAPRSRRFEDRSGDVWIAHPAGKALAGARCPVRRISLHNLARRMRIVDLPPDRTLGDLTNKELVNLV